jgi:dTDP-4-dehydrorhamnose 3,5-epimerase-like enzyme
MKIEIEKCEAYHDERGDLIQFITHSFLKEKSLAFGQIYLLTFNKKGIIRGNHYHNHSSEVFCLISGSVEIICENIATNERIHQILNAENGKFYKIFIGHKIAHAIKSLTDFAVIVSFSSAEYNVNEEDKISHLLISAK